MCSCHSPIMRWSPFPSLGLLAELYNCLDAQNVAEMTHGFHGEVEKATQLLPGSFSFEEHSPLGPWDPTTIL